MNIGRAGGAAAYRRLALCVRHGCLDICQISRCQRCYRGGIGIGGREQGEQGGTGWSVGAPAQKVKAAGRRAGPANHRRLMSPVPCNEETALLRRQPSP